MSLIDEALKRARMEAAQRAAEGEGLPYPTIPRHLGPPRRTGWLVPLVLALAVIAGVVVGLLLASRGGPEAGRVATRELATDSTGTTSLPPPIAAAENTPAGTAEPASNASGAPEPAATPAASRPPTTSDQRESVAAGATPLPMSRPQALPTVATSSAADPETTTQSPPEEPVPAPRAAPLVAPSATPTATVPPPAATAFTDPDSGVLLVLPEPPEATAQELAAEPAPEGSAESYAQQFALPNGGAIELGGIAWSETGPFALINGRVIGPGSVVEGYTLERIRKGHVVLTGDGRRIHLSLQ
jgi:hypothetical protein